MFSLKYRPLFVLFVFVLVVATFSMLACGPNGCGDTRSMSDPLCQPTSGSKIPEKVMDAAGKVLDAAGVNCDTVTDGICDNPITGP